MFWWLLGVGLVLLLLGLPRGDDAALMDAMEEVERFRHGFDRSALEKSLLSHAQAQGVVHLGEVAAGVRKAGGPALRVAPAAPPVSPRAMLNLSSLGEVHALGAKDATIEIGLPDREALTRSIAWRLNLLGAEGNTLESIELIDGTSSAADLQREVDVVEAREALTAAKREFAEANEAHDKAVELHDARKKWKAPWKSIQRAEERRNEAKATLDAKQSARDAAQKRFDALTKKALAFAPAAGGDEGVARVVLGGKKGHTLTLPVGLSRKPVPVPHLTNTGFEAVHAAGLWEELRDGDADAALAAIERRFTWHYQYVEVAGIKLGGMTLLQFGPLSLVLLLWMLVRRSKGVGNTYNPFGAAAQPSLPRVGLGLAPLNLAAVVGLPIAACAVSAWSLGQIDQLAVLPLACGVGCVGLGALGFFEINELSNLRDAVSRSHSNPPPA